MKILTRMLICASLACSGMTASAQEPVQTNRSTPLRAAADDASAVIQTLAEKTTVQVQQRRGPWSQVKVGSNTGWVRMMHLRGGSSVVVEQQSGSNTGYLSGFSRLLLGDRERTRSRQSATVGIRGFSKEDVARAELNPAELEKLKGFQASSAQAQQLANQGRLSFRSVAYLAQDAVEAASKQGARK